MDIYSNEFSNRKHNKTNMDKSIAKQKMKLMKMKRKSEELKLKQKRAIEVKKAKLRKEHIKKKEKEQKRNRKFLSNKSRKDLKTEKKNDENNKKLEKRKIRKVKNISNTRLTEPKKRFLLRRIMLQSQYNRGDFDYVEAIYEELTKEEIRRYKTSKDKEDRIYYKEVQDYEDAKDDVTVRRGWTTFKLGLATVMLVSSIGLLKNTIEKIEVSAPAPKIEITLENASQEQIDKAIMDIGLIEASCGYEFKNLTEDEQIDAMLRIPNIESTISKGEFRNAILTFKDQELLDNIIIETFGEHEYSTYSQEKKDDLKKLAYELLEDDKKEYSRDPKVLKEIAERKEAYQAEIEGRQNSLSQNNQELDDRDDR